MVHFSARFVVSIKTINPLGLRFAVDLKKSAPAVALNLDTTTVVGMTEDHQYIKS